MASDHPIRILFVEDLPTDMELAERNLRKEGLSFVSLRVETKEAFLEALEEFTPELIISDFALPEFDGMQALKLSLEYDATIPFIVSTGSMNEDTAVACMKAGATDYVIKEHITRLPFAVKEALQQRKARLVKEEAGRMLRESEKKYRDLVETVRDIIWSVSPEGTLNGLNLAFEAITGWSRNEWIGRHFGSLIHSEDFQIAVQTIRRCIEGETPPTVELRIRTKDERDVFMEFTATPHREGGEVVGIMGIARDVTERKRTEKALLVLSSRQQALLAAIPDIVIEVDVNKVYTWANQPGFDFFGEDVIGKEANFFFEGEQSTYEIVQPLFDGSESVIYVESWQRRKDGQKRLLAWWCQVLKDKQGNVTGALSSGRDITDLKRAEIALRENEEKFRGLFDNAPVGYLEYDVKGHISRVNQTELEMLGYTRDEMVGHPVWEFNAEDEVARKRVMAKLNGILPPDRNLERTYRRKDGTPMPVLCQDRLILDGQGKIQGIRCTIQDITERKRAEQALRENEEALRVFLNANLGIAVLINAQGIILVTNESFPKRLGKSPNEIVGSCLYDLFPESIAKQRKSHFDEVIRTGNPVNFEDARMDRNFETFAYPVLDEDGNVIKVAILGFDITDRRRIENEVSALQEQLRQSQKMEAIGRLAGGIAHDFNNLLTIINGYSQLSLQELKTEDPLRENIEEIQSAAKRAADLTCQLLAFSRRQILEMRVLDLNNVLRDLDKMLRRVIGEDIELLTVFDKNLGMVKTDPGQVQQVIMNLAVNARDAMPNGGKLTIETANVELDEAYTLVHIAVTPGRYVMVSVSDSGVGMAPEIRERVFEPFFTTKEKDKGTGLGLSTVYGIVKQSEGNIWIYSEPGRGTTIKIYLPRVDEPLESSKEKVVKERLSFGNETILVAEDEEEVRKLAVRVLKQQGYTILEARQGDEALRVCKQHPGPIDLMVTDVVMPRMDGHKLAKQLEAHHPETKVLYMSGYTDNAIVHHGILGEGMNYIQKPFTMDGLATKVREVLDQ